MVCLGNMCVDTLHKGDNDDDDNNNNKCLRLPICASGNWSDVALAFTVMFCVMRELFCLLFSRRTLNSVYVTTPNLNVDYKQQSCILNTATSYSKLTARTRGSLGSVISPWHSFVLVERGCGFGRCGGDGISFR